MQNSTPQHNKNFPPLRIKNTNEGEEKKKFFMHSATDRIDYKIKRTFSLFHHSANANKMNF
jgi:hypothetical protein